MRAETTRELIRRLSAKATEHDGATATAADPAARTVDAHFFTDPKHLELERSILLTTPQVIGFACELGPGEYQARDIMGRPVLLTRAQDGELRAFLNACRHRGAQVAMWASKNRRCVTRSAGSPNPPVIKRDIISQRAAI